MNPVKWSDPAVSDLYAIDDYLTTYSVTSAERVVTKIEQAAAFLATMPAAGPVIRRGEARKWRVATTPYLLVYRILDDRIEVLRVHHGRENWSSE